MRMLLLSNGRKKPGKLLEFVLNDINGFIGEEVKEIVFIPFARVLMDWDSYTQQIIDAFSSTKYKIKSIHMNNDMYSNVENAECILVGGGNTFNLLHCLYKYNLLELLKEKINSETKYIAWSAGSNIVSPTIKTTNDMPIIDTPSLKALGIIPHQINPHFISSHVGQIGETREQRIKEFLVVNPESKVLCLSNNTYIKVIRNNITFHGAGEVYIFENGHSRKIELSETMPVI